MTSPAAICAITSGDRVRMVWRSGLSSLIPPQRVNLMQVVYLYDVNVLNSGRFAEEPAQVWQEAAHMACMVPIEVLSGHAFDWKRWDMIGLQRRPALYSYVCPHLAGLDARALCHKTAGYIG